MNQNHSEDNTGAVIDEDYSILKRNEIPIAKLYLKFMHIDKNQDENSILINEFQDKVLEDLLSKLNDKI
jgi:hypothetical protein